MRHKRYVLRNKKSRSISSRPDQARLANLMKAAELIATCAGGIPTLMTREVAQNQKTLDKVALTNDLDYVEGRNRDNVNAPLGQTLSALVTLFLCGKQKNPPRANSAKKFYEWLQQQMHKTVPEGSAPNAVQMLAGRGSPLRYMGSRQVKDAYTLIRKMQS